MTNLKWYHRIHTVEWLQIAAALTAATRWSIALMPLDGVKFRYSESPLFEGASFVLSLAFAVVEIGATAYMMRAWRKEQDRATRRTLGILWVTSLIIMLVAQVPPLLVNIDGADISAQPGWLKIAWVTCGVAMTFVIIGGVGYAERSIETTTVKPVETPAMLVPNQPVELRSITRDDITAIWNAHGAGGYSAVSEIAHQTLNGRSAKLEEWYLGQKRISTLCEALGVDGQDAKNVSCWVKFRNARRG